MEVERRDAFARGYTTFPSFPLLSGSETREITRPTKINMHPFPISQKNNNDDIHAAFNFKKVNAKSQKYLARLHA
jgi:hypothetical protein